MTKPSPIDGLVVYDATAPNHTRVAELEELSTFVKDQIDTELLKNYKDKYSDRELIMLSLVASEYVIRLKREGKIEDASEFSIIFAGIHDILKTKNSVNDKIKVRKKGETDGRS